METDPAGTAMNRSVSNAPPLPATQPVKKDRHIVSWTPQEDDLLREKIALLGTENWTSIAAQFKDKTSRQCRRRWYTYLNTECKKGGWSAEEDMLLCEAQKIFGNRWTEIAKVVSGRTDNAVKNRFSTLCKKRAKLEASFKENNNPFLNSNNKRVIIQQRCSTALTGDLSAPKKQIRYHASEVTKNIEYERFKEHQLKDESLRPPLAPLVHNINMVGRITENVTKSLCDVSGKENQGTFLKRDDPKLMALLQQAELLTSLSMKVNSEKTDQSLDDAWKELQDYLIQTEDGGSLRIKVAGMDLLLDELKDVIEDSKSSNMERQQPFRPLDSHEDSHGSPEHSTGSSYHRNAEGKICKSETVDCSISKDPKVNDLQNDKSCSEVNVCPCPVLPSSVQLKEDDENICNITNSEFASPLQTIPPFQSFGDGVPSPAFTASERHFLLTVLNLSSPCSSSDFSKQPSCKRVLLDSLPPS